MYVVQEVSCIPTLCVYWRPQALALSYNSLTSQLVKILVTHETRFSTVSPIGKIRLLEFSYVL